MKRFSVGLVLLLLSTFSIFAQNKVITVSGRVVESDSKEPTAQATVQLLSLPIALMLPVLPVIIKVGLLFPK